MYVDIVRAMPHHPCMSILSGPDETTPERVLYWLGSNARFRKFVKRAEALGWMVEGSTVARDCIVVRHPRTRDHFVLYPSGIRSTASLRVYDGRDGYEFSPVPARTALAFISEHRQEA